MKLSEKEKSKILSEMKKTLLVINDGSGLTENFVVNINNSSYILNEEWVLKYSDIKKVKFKIFLNWKKLHMHTLMFYKTIVFIDKNKEKYNLNISYSSIPFFNYDDIEIIKKIIKLLKSKNKSIIIDDRKIKKLEQ